MSEAYVSIVQYGMYVPPYVRQAVAMLLFAKYLFSSSRRTNIRRDCSPRYDEVIAPSKTEEFLYFK